MSDQPTLPPPSIETLRLTYEHPNVLVSAKEGGVHIMNGCLVQTPHTLTKTYYTSKPAARPVFKPGRQSRIGLAGHTVNVLCDNGVFNGLHLTESAPNATDYMGAIGQEVVISYVCAPIPPEVLQKKYQGQFTELWREDVMTLILPPFHGEEA